MDGTPVVMYMPIVGPGVIRLEALSPDPTIFTRLCDAQADEYDRRIRMQACTQVAKLTAVEVSVNVFPRCLARPCFPGEIADLLIESGLPAHRLILEIVETEPLEPNLTVSENVHRIARMGVRISIDDYGCGHATFERVTSALSWGAFHSLKACLPEMDEAALLAECYGLEVVVERVETHAQYESVRARGFLAQGYYIGKKLPFDHFNTWLGGWISQ